MPDSPSFIPDGRSPTRPTVENPIRRSPVEVVGLVFGVVIIALIGVIAVGLLAWAAVWVWGHVL